MVTLNHHPFSPSDLFLGPDLSEERASHYLEERGFREPAAADRNIQLMADGLLTRQALSLIATPLLDCLTQSPDPDAALVGFSRYLATRVPKRSFLRYLRDDPSTLQILTHLLGTSPFLTEILIRNPEYLHWLQQQLEKPPPSMLDYVAELDELLVTTGNAKQQLDALKRLQRRELLRIAGRDILGRDSLQAVTFQLSNLATIVTDGALRISCEQNLNAARLERLPGTFAVIAMGKLGGQELNYSSDIDLIYVYDPDLPEELKSHHFFKKLGRTLTAALTDYSAESYLYRVDLRLRPMGRRGSIACSLSQCQHYYETWGETFERFALIKARPIAGDTTLGERFIEMVRPFVYRRYLDHAALEEMSNYKSRMDRTHVRPGKMERNVKLGPGGIREVELFTQVLQLLYGGSHPELQKFNTLTSLDNLCNAGFISKTVRENLAHAYTFLRTVEHRLQIVQQNQTHSVAENTTEREIFARRMGFRTFSSLETELRNQRNHVRTVYRTLFESNEEQASLHSRQFLRILSGELSDRETLEYLKIYQFQDRNQVLNIIRALDQVPSIGHAKSATRNILANLLSTLMRQVKRYHEPEQILNRFERVATQTGVASSFFRSLLENDQIRDTLLTILDAGELPAQRLVRHPELFDFLVDPGRDLATVFSEVQAGLTEIKNHKLQERMKQVRRVKSIEETKILFEWLSGGTLESLQQKLSSLADCCVERSTRSYLLQQSTDAKHQVLEQQQWAVLALGKLGGRELTIHSDLDLVFLYEGDPQDVETFTVYQSFARSIQEFLEETTSEGFAYRIDTRLRPEGSKGALALPRCAFESYLQNRAELWERLAWTRYRFLIGSQEMAAKIDAAVSGFVYNSWDDRIPSYMETIRLRMEQELAQETTQPRFNFKIGKGGLADIDFLLQLIQVHEGRERPEFQVTGTQCLLAHLPENPFINEQELKQLQEAYRFLRALEVLVRVESDSSINWISKNTDRMESIGQRLGLSHPAGKALLDHYRQVTDEVRATYMKVMQRLPRQ